MRNFGQAIRLFRVAFIWVAASGMVPTSAQEAALPGAAPSSDIRLSVELVRVAVDELKTKEQFILSVENKGDDVYEVPSQVGQLWSVSLSRQGWPAESETL